MDSFSKEIRRKTMQAVKSKYTKLENRVITELWRKGVRFRRNVNDLKGKPDIAVKKYRVAIFIDSCFWHGCKLHCRIPETNKEYWAAKIYRNRMRDKATTKYYRTLAWNVLRIWEHDVDNDFERTIDKIIAFINKARKPVKH